MSALLLVTLAGLASATPIKLFDLESDDGDFVASGDPVHWGWGVVTNGPAAGFDGARAWSTGLTSDYLNDGTGYLELDVPNLAGAERATLSFQHWYDIALGDVGWIEVETDNEFIPVTPLYGYPVDRGFVGSSGGWRTVVVDLSAFGPQPRVRLAFHADLASVGDGWTIDQVAFHDGDVAAPRLSELSALSDTEDLDGPYVVEVNAEDDTLVDAVTLHWVAGGVESAKPMDPMGGGGWRGEIPAQAVGTEVVYWVEATDGVNEAREPLDTELGFRVYLPAPTTLTGPSGRVVGATVPLSWTAPDSEHAVLGYEVLRGGLTVAEVTDPWADVPILGGLETFAVRAVYEAGPGDLSEPIVLDGVLPVVRTVEPDSGWPGETVRVRVTGDYLLLVQGDVAAELGAGITVESIDVRDVDSAWLELSLSENATPGLRPLTLHTGGTSVVLADAFEVLPDMERPRLTAIEPSSLQQGDEGELVIDFFGDLAGTPAVDLGLDIVVESVERTENDGLVVRYVVAGDAALGVRRVTVDDGVRVFEGVTLEVADAHAAPARGCGTPVAPGLALVGLGLAALVGRRRP